ncbi:MAG: hypothetical protein KDA52_05410 [Planctomycetaceae bacterium]|nr:hypothetical protein [Planctomycetaceae bacterium]
MKLRKKLLVVLGIWTLVVLLVLPTCYLCGGYGEGVGDCVFLAVTANGEPEGFCRCLFALQMVINLVGLPVALAWAFTQ